ncbi:MAG TPA: IS4 family transposase, partial [Acidobacteriota bacterium]
VKTQLWIAVSIYVLVAIVKKQLKSDLSLYTILQILSVSLFEKIPLNQTLTESDFKFEESTLCKQFSLFNF